MKYQVNAILKIVEFWVSFFLSTPFPQTVSEFAHYGSSNETTVNLKNIFQTLDLNNNGKIEPIEIDNSLEGKNGLFVTFGNKGGVTYNFKLKNMVFTAIATHL